MANVVIPGAADPIAPQLGLHQWQTTAAVSDWAQLARVDVHCATCRKLWEDVSDEPCERTPWST